MSRGVNPGEGSMYGGVSRGGGYVQGRVGMGRGRGGCVYLPHTAHGTWHTSPSTDT